MGLAGFTLADRLGAKTAPCSVPGCTRTWISMASATTKGKGLSLGGRGAADPSDPASSMCDPCRATFAKATDTERPCDRPGCDGTWTWPAMAQVEAAATRRQPPTRLCAGCDAKLESLSDKALPCAVPGCSRTSLFSRKAQMLAGAPEIDPELPPVRCAQCEGVYRKLKDRAVRCGINGCDHKWPWSADEQILAYAAGLTNDPPRRMCDGCKAAFGAIADREVRCRTSGCKKTWVWSRGDQLDACIAGKAPPKAPHRMCESCVGIYQALKDVERPCRRSGCKGTWLDKRGGQLARAVRGKTGDPYPQYCDQCAKEIDDLEDRQIACKTDNCTGTWTWTKAAQLAAGVRPTFRGEDSPEAATPVAEATGAEAAPAVATAPELTAEAPAENGTVVATTTSAPPAGKSGRQGRRKNKRRREVRPPERRCQNCNDFLTDRKTMEIPCKHCGTPIYWPPESQLQTHLGAWAEPQMCGACKRDATEAARNVEREALRHGGAAAQIVADAAAEAAAGAAPEAPPSDPANGAPATDAPSSS